MPNYWDHFLPGGHELVHSDTVRKIGFTLNTGMTETDTLHMIPDSSHRCVQPPPQATS